MSRCFPFPPPGYEKKSRTDDVDLLKKERHREKKHKKEKKDKAKKESKEKGEKEGRDGKHKDKKEKKEKKKEKKKDKDKDKDKGKDKSKISAANEKGFPTQAQGLNGINLHQKEIKQNDTKDILFDDRLTKQYASNNGEMARANNHLVEENKDSKFRMELDRRIRDNDGRAGNQLGQKFTIADCRKDEGTVRLVAKSSGTGTWPDGKEKFEDKGVDGTKIDGRGIWAEAQPIGNAAVQNHAGNCYPRVNEKPRPLEKIFVKTLEGTVEGTERVKEKKDDKRGDKKKDDKRGDKKKDDKRGDKRKEQEKEKKGHGKDKDRDKKKKKEDKAKEKIEHRNGEQNKLKESNKAGPIGLNSSAQVSKHSHENSIIGENLNKQKEIDSNGVLHGEYHNKNLNKRKEIDSNGVLHGECHTKRKEIDSNGFLHANDSRPSKLPRPSSSHPFTENGRILEPCQISLQNASDGPVAATNVKVENKERKTNGIIEAPTSAVSPKKIPTAPKPADPVTKISTKPPHPDTKYISEVYSVPKANEWSDFDDQEWLFGSNHSQERKPVVKSSEVVDTLQVWAEVVHIEPADVFALPYVIPY